MHGGFCVMLIGFDETRKDTGGKAVIKIEQTEISVPLIYNLLTFDPFGGTIIADFGAVCFFLPKKEIGGANLCAKN